MKVPEKYRIISGGLATDSSYGNNGFFLVPFESFVLRVQASNGLSWDHVSISLANRIPNWREMCFIKDMFFDPEDCVVQYHPPKNNYVNIHNNCLHLWKPQNEKLPIPPIELV